MNLLFIFLDKGRVQKFMLGKLVDFSIKRAGGVPLRKIDDK